MQHMHFTNTFSCLQSHIVDIEDELQFRLYPMCGEAQMPKLQKRSALDSHNKEYF